MQERIGLTHLLLGSECRTITSSLSSKCDCDKWYQSQVRLLGKYYADMLAKKQLGKSQTDRLAKIEEQLLCMSEIPDEMGLLESRMNEMSAKSDRFNEKARHLETMSILELMTRVEALEDKATRASIFERGDFSTGSVARMEEYVEGLYNAQLAIVQMVSDLSEDFRESLRMARAKVADLDTRLNLTMRAVGDETPTGGVARFKKIKVPEPKPSCGVRDAKALENFIFNHQ